MRPGNAATGPENSVTLPDEVAQSLNLLNGLQKAYDQLTFKIESRQQNLFPPGCVSCSSATLIILSFCSILKMM